MSYSQILKFLRQRGNEVKDINLGLHRTLAMMQALGNPHLRYPVIHIAGTNGKGSVAAISDSILRQAGWITGIYTSPHLVKIEERIRINGRQISSRSFIALATHIRKTEKRLLRKKLLDRPLTYFEFLTICAFLHFAQRKIDIAVVEVGLGGKLDATNVVHPQVGIITGVSLDHQNYLGNTLIKIAREKAGIIKSGVPIISGCRKNVVRRIIRSRVRAVGAPLLEIYRNCSIRISDERKGCYTFDLQTPNRQYRRLRLSLAGKHQIHNAALAVTAIDALPSFPVGMGDVRRALARTCWPGRLDEYRSYRRTLLDGAHNPEGSRLLRDFLRSRKEVEIHFLFGALADKDIKKMSQCIFPLAKSIHLAPLANSRSADPKAIAALHPSYGNRIYLHNSTRDALYATWKMCSPSGLVVVTGSLYLLGELLPLIHKHAK